MNAKLPPAACPSHYPLARGNLPIHCGLLALPPMLGLAPLNAAAASEPPAVVVPASVFIGLWFLLGIIVGVGVGGAIVLLWRFIKRRQGRHAERPEGAISTFHFYAMVFWSAILATGTDVVFKLLAAHGVFFEETLTHPRALMDWQLLPGLNLPQTFLVMGVASLMALLIVRRLARQTDLTGHASAWMFAAATGILISIFVTMVSGIFFPALDFWRVPGFLVLNFADEIRRVNLADLIGYLAVGLGLIAVIVGWRHYHKTQRDGGPEQDRRMR